MKYLENRIPPLIVAGVIGIVMWVTSICFPIVATSMETRVAGAVVVALIGVTVCMVGVISFRRQKTTVNPQRPESTSALVISGIYHYSRNPMYVGFALLLIALAVYLSSLVSLVGVFVFVLYINRFQIEPEERALKELFGAEYERYKLAVRRWL